ncbi:MAG TPA: OmpH family outer membrane protein [Aminivibrio sp.]|jgi:outer membrane protein|uniref:OmpH family outer membrane protein n=1 Tax=Aminivibrio sp. TaxID=1872489 RepID=UPI002CE6E1AC|nr:OmpH family outer membrane protein [Aminivibrio sp.]MDD3515333.1 OmpH family outer membrane protein [Synergistaceae bacterium]HPF84044.1 OmpH family outer membrane protein [Aminivibrio sp.]HPK06870.1 OmpH family outer membrane protein [Aminivibrio sp.]HRX25743.1 OmpH family outer membrane protein [Aminivibrio sp.]
MFSVKRLGVLLSVAVLFVIFTSVVAAADEKIGVIDSQKIIFQHPRFEGVTKQLQQISRTKENEMKLAVDKEPDQNKKAQIFNTKRNELAQEEQRLMQPIFKEAELAVRTVAKVKKVTVVIEKSAVYFGGIDITDDVIQELKKNAAKK